MLFSSQGHCCNTSKNGSPSNLFALLVFPRVPRLAVPKCVTVMTLAFCLEIGIFLAKMALTTGSSMECRGAWKCQGGVGGDCISTILGCRNRPSLISDCNQAEVNGLQGQTHTQQMAVCSIVGHRHLDALCKESQFNPSEEGIDAFELVVSLTPSDHLNQALASVAIVWASGQQKPGLGLND